MRRAPHHGERLGKIFFLDQYRKLVARGEFELSDQVYVQNRHEGSRNGFRVITPLRLEGSDIRVLVNRGELIQPAVPLPADLDLRTPGGAPINPHALSGKWTLVFLAGSACTDDCPHRLRDLRQIRLAVGARLLGRLGGGSAALNRVYILDPMGNLMMRYPPNAPAKHTL